MVRLCLQLTRSIHGAQIKLPSPLQPAQPQEGGLVGFECLNRNARRGKKANHGKRPVSSARRKYKTKKFGRK
jgi:hypothetical protein